MLINRLLFTHKSLSKVFNIVPMFRCYAAATSLNKPLHVFVCAADEASDSAGAALVASLKQQHKQGVHLYGVGGPLLQAQGLQCVVSDEQYQQLAAAEVVQQAYGLQKLQGFSLASRKEYLKIFRDTIWEAALHGCSSQNKASQGTSKAQQPKQQQRSTVTIGQAQLPASLAYDAVLTIGSATASQQVLLVLRKAEEQKKARLPVLVQYMAPGLWDHQQVSAAAAAWGKLTDHIMCSLPFEPALLHKSGGHASFVGHPLVEPLLQDKSFGSRKAAVVQLLQAKVTSAAVAGSEASTPSSSSSIAARQQSLASVGQLFSVGDPAAFWRVFDNMCSKQHNNSSSSSAEGSPEPSSVSSPTSSGGSSKRRKAAADKQLAPQQRLHNSRLLLCLLPGSTESEVRSSMPAFDAITKELLQCCPNLVAAMILPAVLVEAGIQATNNFAVPVVVLPAGSTHSTDALAAAAAALSHPGPESLRAAVAGVPLVCVRDGSVLVEGLSSWRSSGVLPFGCIPNLVLGLEAVPEFKLWVRGARGDAVAAVAQLLTNSVQRPAAAIAAAGSSSSSRASAHPALQDLLLQLVAHQQQQHQHLTPHINSRGSHTTAAAAAGVPRISVQSPSGAAASMLLQLVALRKQQEAEQLQALLASQQA